jgi:ABC-2 type transport system ATP-binding protein
VSKRFGTSAALRDLSFEVDRGEVIGLLGPNGAGKTTTFRILTGYLDPDEGSVEVAGIDVATERAEACRHIGYLPEAVPLYGEMRVADYLRFRGRLKGVAKSALAGRLDAVTKTAVLDEVLDKPITHLSRGFRQRVGLADALIAEPEVLLLDEPTVGLDPVQIRELRELIASLAGKHTIVLSSHVLAEVEALATRLVVIVSGRVVAQGTVPELRTELGFAEDADLEDVFVALAAGEDAG